MKRARSGASSWSKKHVAYALFLGANVLWFFWTLLYVSGPVSEDSTSGGGRNRKSDPYDSGPSEEFPFGEPLSVRDARAKGVLSPRRAAPKSRMFGSVLRTDDEAAADLPSVLTGAALDRASTVKDLT
eukprot:3065181-Pyramimonas_sp.AAC.1